MATVAAVLLDPLPDHLTILDSPDSLVPILGGALNDLSSYLRIVAPGGERDDTFVDNYRSHFGVPYGTRHGLGSIVDVTLDPEIAIVPEPPSGHAYAWAWYLHTAQNPELGVGYAWSPLRPTPSVPGAAQLRQAGSADADPFRLEHHHDTEPGVVGAKARTRTRRKRDRTTVLSTSGRTHAYGLFWRRSGDLWASAPVERSHGPDTATLSVYTNLPNACGLCAVLHRTATESSTSRSGGARLGPMLIKVELDSDAPAEVKFANARAVHGFVLPAGSEAQAWLRPAVLGATFVAITFAGWALKRVMRTRP